MSSHVNQKMADYRRRRRGPPHFLSSRFKHPQQIAPVQNKFANDGSFLEMFKKKMEENTPKVDNETSTLADQFPASAKPTGAKNQTDSNGAGGAAAAAAAGEKLQHEADTRKKTSLSSLVGKRRGGTRTLKTGVVKKPKPQDAEGAGGGTDAWTKYMEEVKRYRAQMCLEDEKSRPLVK